MTGFERLGIVWLAVVWYVSVRKGFLYIVAHDDGRVDNFTWWWSWVIAVPASVLALMIIAAVAGAIWWVIKGFRK